jgi:hypothetical protein
VARFFGIRDCGKIFCSLEHGSTNNEKLLMKLRVSLILFWAMVLTFICVRFAGAQNTSDAAPAKEGVMKSDEVGGRLFPDKVFFRGQSASVQAAMASW